MLFLFHSLLLFCLSYFKLSLTDILTPKSQTIQFQVSYILIYYPQTKFIDSINTNVYSVLNRLLRVRVWMACHGCVMDQSHPVHSIHFWRFAVQSIKTHSSCPPGQFSRNHLQLRHAAVATAVCCRLLLWYDSHTLQYQGKSIFSQLPSFIDIRLWNS